MCKIMKLSLFICMMISNVSICQTIVSDASVSGRNQIIDGFGTCLSGESGEQTWFQNLYFDDAACSIVRFDMTPIFKTPYSDFLYNSPWFHGNPSLPGPDNNNVRTYTNAGDYTRVYAGRSAPIAVMGPNITTNQSFFDFDNGAGKTAGILSGLGDSKKSQLTDFKITGSIWSPMPWIKIASGNSYQNSTSVLPANGSLYPFIWNGNFVGGKIDVSNTPLPVFFDGIENTSALTQFARATAAYIRAFQNKYNVKMYAFSIQNELNFETFYNSSFYPLSSQYIAALIAVRNELNKYPDLATIKIMGPEDLLSDGSYALWQYGSGAGTVHKNLQYLQEIAANPQASAAVSFFNIHGYAADGIGSAGANPVSWERWANGWTSPAAAGLPANVVGFRSYNKKSWMTETSGENPAWLWPETGFPNEGAFSIALNMYQALTTGYESAYVYWQMSDDDPNARNEQLTGSGQGANSPKYIAFKHFSKFIRPNATRLNTTISPSAGNVNAVGFVHDANKTLTYVIINADNAVKNITVGVPANLGFPLAIFQGYSSSNNNYWQNTNYPISSNQISLSLPAYSVTTLYGQQPTSLAVGFLNFSVKSTESANILNWKSETQTNCSGYEILKSKDGTNFSLIKFEKSKSVLSMNNILLEYSFSDIDNAQDQFYKIVELDINGNKKTSSAKFVGANLTNNPVKIYPNPTAGLFYIQTKSIGSKITIRNQEGKTIKILISDSKTVSIDASRWINGIYKVEIQNGLQKSEKMIVVYK